MGELLPRLSILTLAGGLFLLHFPGSRLRLTLSAILPYEARTFLTVIPFGMIPRNRSAELLTNYSTNFAFCQPSDNHSADALSCPTRLCLVAFICKKGCRFARQPLSQNFFSIFPLILIRRTITGQSTKLSASSKRKLPPARPSII